MNSVFKLEINSELAKIAAEFAMEKEINDATSSGSESLTAELEQERANLATQSNGLSVCCSFSADISFTCIAKLAHYAPNSTFKL